MIRLPLLTSVVEREGEVDKDLLSDALPCPVGPLDDVVDLADRRRDEQTEDKSEDVPVPAPEVDVNGVQEAEESETPPNGVDDDFLSAGRELVDDRAEEEQVYQGPHPECL